MERRSSLVPVISLTVVVSFSLSAPGREIEKGRLLDGIACRADAGQSYALYLPSGDDRVELQPVLFLFDPAARGEGRKASGRFCPRPKNSAGSLSARIIRKTDR